jgi:phage terminase large subunit-like protein
MAEWQNVGQGYQSFSPRLEALETGLLQRRLLMDNHPALNMGMANALAVTDPAGNRKLVKPKDNGPRIDAAVALVMAVYPILAKQETLGEDISHWIG